jgi:hypothetical protein
MRSQITSRIRAPLLHAAYRHLSAEQRRSIALTSWTAGELVDLVRPSFWRNHRKVEACRERHKGQRCFILGNGPSLAEADLASLRGEIVFTLNRGYLAFPRMGFTSTYHVAINPLVVEQSAAEIAALNVDELFVAWDMRHSFAARPLATYVRLVRGPWFGENLPHGLWGGHTVTYAALQIAYFMGFDEVVLLGVDHRFSTQGEPNALQVSTGPDRDHFDPEYFGAGIRWHLPDLATSTLAYRLADVFYRTDGRVILDATKGGALDVFPKVDLGSVLGRTREKVGF